MANFRISQPNFSKRKIHYYRWKTKKPQELEFCANPTRENRKPWYGRFFPFLAIFLTLNLNLTDIKLTIESYKWSRPTFHIRLVTSKNIDIRPSYGPKTNKFSGRTAFGHHIWAPFEKKSILVFKRPPTSHNLRVGMVKEFRYFSVKKGRGRPVGTERHFESGRPPKVWTLVFLSLSTAISKSSYTQIRLNLP